MMLKLRSRTPRREPAPSSLPAKRKGVFRASLLQSPARSRRSRSRDFWAS